MSSSEQMKSLYCISLMFSVKYFCRRKKKIFLIAKTAANRQNNGQWLSLDDVIEDTSQDI